jgi:hypothetical protein
MGTNAQTPGAYFTGPPGFVKRIASGLEPGGRTNGNPEFTRNTSEKTQQKQHDDTRCKWRSKNVTPGRVPAVDS